MNTTIKGNIVKVKRGSFTNANSGELISYCHFYVLVAGSTNENETGFDYKKFKCKVDNYNRILDFLKSNKPVDISCLLFEQKDGSYQPRVVSIDDYKII